MKKNIYNSLQGGRARFAILFSVLSLIAITACDKLIEDGVHKSDLKKDVELITDKGTIIIRLSDETPKHRNNFIKMVNQGYLDSLSFYRVVNHFLIQTGMDVSDDMPPLIDKEISDDLFHKRGSVNAARGDDDLNPEQASANFHFTIIQGRIYTDSLLDVSEKRINNWIAYNRVIHKPENKDIFTHLQDIYKKHDSRDSIRQVKEHLNELTGKELESMDKYRIPDDHREAYKTIGGAAHLDQNYTVFGQVVKGMSVVDKIASVETDRTANPLKDIYILSASMIKRVDYDNSGD